MDQDMSHARACLNLVESMLEDSKSSNKLDPTSEKILEECSRLIQSEVNLIEATRLILDADYIILPAKIRASDNRIDIIKDILASKETAYKNYEELIKLAQLMCPVNDKNGENRMFPQLRQMIAEHALKRRNLSIANKMCIDLIELNYEPAWSCVYNLAFSYARNLMESHEIDKINDNVFLSIASFSFDTRYSNKVSKNKNGNVRIFVSNRKQKIEKNF